MRKVFTILFLILAHLSILSKTDTNKNISAIKLNQPLILDGKLSEEVYKHSPAKGFIQRDPDEGKDESEKTHVWITYDESNLYVSAKLYDSEPTKIDANLMRRDNIVESDWFFFFVDPYNDKRTGYYFAVNPGGSIADGILFNDSWDDDSWNGIWSAETSVDDDGWSMEMKIPFSQMRFNETENMTWGVNFNRDIKRKKESTFYVMVPKKESGFVSHFAELKGLNGIQSKQRFELLPYLVQKAQYLTHENDDPFYKSRQYKTTIGADFKIGVGSNLSIDGTINPDFGQVEVDPAVVNLSAFESFFPEKRPFFIEGSNIFFFGVGGSNNNWGFNFGIPELFYSRRIGRSPQGSAPDADFTNYPGETRILGAAKLTGKIDGGWSIGTVNAVTERTYATLDTSGRRFEKEVEPLTHYGVVRTQKEFNDGKQALGMIFTSVNRDLGNEELNSTLSKNAYTFGIDGWTFLDEDETYVLTGNLIGSYVEGSAEAIAGLQEQPYRYFQRPDASFIKYDAGRTSLAGWFSRIMLNKQKGNFYINTAIGAVSPKFEFNDLGFQWTASKFNGHMVLGYRWYEPDKIFRRKTIHLAHFRDYNFDGDNVHSGLMLFSDFQFLNYYGLNFRASYNFEDYDDKLTRGGPLVKNPAEHWFNIQAYSDSREKLQGEAWFSRSKDNIGSYDNLVGFWLQWKPNTQIEFSIGPEFSQSHEMRQWVDNIEDPAAINTFNHRYVFGEISRRTWSGNIRLNWTFTPELSLQLFVQPLLAVGKYKNYKELKTPGTYDFNNYGKENTSITYNEEDEEYTINPDIGGGAQPFIISNRDFNFKSLRANLVLRYEVLPGSVLFLVWSHDRTNFDDPGNFNFKRDFTNLWNADTDDIFLVKFSYWLDV